MKVDDKVYIGVGANLHDRLRNIKKAIKWLNSLKIKVLRCSPIYETKPQSDIPQDYFLNCVVQVSTYYSPHTLLDKLKSIERQLGRKPTYVKWAPRPIDLDILLYKNMIVQSHRLCIPHARLCERDFVLLPLLHLAPDLIHPTKKSTIKQLYESLTSSTIIR